MRVALFLLVVAAGCTAARPGDAPEASPSPALVGPTWRLLEAEMPGGRVVSPDGGAPYTLRFGADGRYDGQADCNRVGGSFEDLGGGGLRLDHGLSTLAACPSGSVDGDVRAVLGGVSRYAVSGDRLRLSGEAGTLVLTRGDAPGAADALLGPEWRLVQIRPAAGEPVEPQGDNLFTIAFVAGGQFSGRADCNRYGGSYTALPGGDLVLSNAATTIAECAPPSSSRAFFGTLNQVVGFDVAGGQLTLRGAAGGALVFERSGGPDVGGMPPQETLRDYAYTCSSDEGPFTFHIRTGPGEIALWLPDRFEGREGGTYRVLGQVVSASGAKYQDGPVTVWTKGQTDALLEVDGEEFLRCRSDPERAGRLVLRGTGDGWYLEVRMDGDRARLRLVGTFEDRTATATVARSGDRTVYRADGLVVTTTDAPCTDADSGDVTDTQVTVELDGRTHQGCGQRAG